MNKSRSFLFLMFLTPRENKIYTHTHARRLGAKNVRYDGRIDARHSSGMDAGGPGMGMGGGQPMGMGGGPGDRGRART